jgi:hypothetical protein
MPKMSMRMIKEHECGNPMTSKMKIEKSKLNL